MDCDMTESPIDLFLRDASATDTLGAALALAYARLTPAPGAVLYLHGELGAGKTTCVRSLLRTLGVDGSIRSPTYTLVEAYELPELTCVHVDLYRLQAVAEVEELDLLDYLQRRALLLVEWPEKGACRLPPADLELTLAYVNLIRYDDPSVFHRSGGAARLRACRLRPRRRGARRAIVGGS
jgi:tRNA threonylcarbamoyladenosine biosynthesis protein TsaE